jgi:hypothetical protein
MRYSDWISLGNDQVLTISLGYSTLSTLSEANPYTAYVAGSEPFDDHSSYVE